MRLARVGHRRPCHRRAAALVVAGLVLAGCSSPSTPSSTSDSWFTGRVSNLFGSEDRAQLAGTPATAAFDPRDCPDVDIRTGASTLTVAAKGGQQPTANDLRYQLSFHQTARKCSVRDGMLVIRVGVQGRVVLGPAGGPGQVEVPLRYALVREGVEPRTLATKFKRIPVTVAPGETNVVFTDVEEDLSAAMPALRDLQASVIYVGFDDLANEKKPPAKGAAKKSPPRTN